MSTLTQQLEASLGLENQGKLAAKMVLAMKQIDAVAKNGTNKFQNYKYVQAADVAHEVRKALVDNGIAFNYSVIKSDRWERVKKNESVESCVELLVEVTFTDQESGESKTVNSIGWGMDALDKAPYKAMTGAIKYALRMNFLIPDDADPENDSGDKPQQETRRAQPSPTSPDPYDIDNFIPAEVNYESEPAPVVRKQSGPVISEAQGKRFFGIAMGAGKSKAEINHYLASRGYAATSDIQKADYETVCAWAGGK